MDRRDSSILPSMLYLSDYSKDLRELKESCSWTPFGSPSGWFCWNCWFSATIPWEGVEIRPACFGVSKTIGMHDMLGLFYRSMPILKRSSRSRAEPNVCNPLSVNLLETLVLGILGVQAWASGCPPRSLVLGLDELIPCSRMILFCFLLILFRIELWIMDLFTNKSSTPWSLVDCPVPIAFLFLVCFLLPRLAQSIFCIE